MEYFIVQYFYWNDGCPMNHSFETYQKEYYNIKEVKAVADRVIVNNKDS